MAGLQVRISTARRQVLQQGEGVDVGAFVCFAKSMETVIMYGTLMAARFSTREFHRVELRAWQWSAMLAAECRVAERSSIIIQYLATQGAMENMGELSRPSHEISFGYKSELSAGVLLEVAVLENLFIFDNSPDVGVHFAMTWVG